MRGKRYSDAQRAEALALLKANNGNLFRTAHELKMPVQTLANWAKDTREPVDGFPELVAVKEEQLAEMCERVARKYMKQALDPFCVASTPGDRAMITAGIAIDKNRLLNDLPTTITGPSKSALLAELVAKFQLTENQAQGVVSEIYGSDDPEPTSDSVS